MMNLQGPNFEVDAVMPNSLRNSAPGYAPADRIRIYSIVSTAAAFTLQDGAGSGPQNIAQMSAAGSISYNPPLEVADFKMTSFTGPGQVTIFTK